MESEKSLSESGKRRTVQCATIHTVYSTSENRVGLGQSIQSSVIVSGPGTACLWHDYEYKLDLADFLLFIHILGRFIHFNFKRFLGYFAVNYQF